MIQKIRKISFIATFTIAIILSVTAQTLDKITQRGELRVGMSANQPPFTMKANDGSVIGYEVDLATMLAEVMGVKLKIVEIPFPELLSALETEKIDIVMSGMTMTFKRNMRVAFAGPYLLSGKSVLTKSAAFSETKSAEELNDEKIKLAVLKGSTSESYVLANVPEAEVVLANSYNEALQKLENDEVSILVADYPFCVYTVLVHPEKNLITLDQPLTIEPIGMALPPNDAHMYNLVQNYMTALTLIGVLDLLEEKWFESGEWVPLVEK